jgi:NAD(P)-dependent dehydrogenase (short-subunit alcohol dehydrogenase family)
VRFGGFVLSNARLLANDVTLLPESIGRLVKRQGRLKGIYMTLMRTWLPAAIAGATALAATRLLRERRRMEFANRSVLITGGSRGLGLVMARMFAAEGARLTLLARNGVELERAADELRANGAQVLTIVCDVSDRLAVEQAVEQTVAHFGSLDVLINNAGIIQAGPLDHMQLEDFETAINVHFWGPLYATRAALPHMRRQGGGRVINISSIGGVVAVPHLAPYCASKFALTGLSDALRSELVRDNILVTTVCPGLMRTGSHPNALFKGQHEAEFTLFSIIDALPPFSVDAEFAARQIVEACRYGDSHLTISVPAHLARIVNATLPRLTGNLMALANAALPGPTGPEGDQLKTGWESQTALSPSLLTRLADRATVANNGMVAPTAKPESIMPAIEAEQERQVGS